VNVDGRTLSFADVAGSKGTVVMFICNHCPFVKHVADQLASLGRGLCFRRESASWPSMPTTSRRIRRIRPSRWCGRPRSRGYPFPYLFDDTQHVADAYQAACTPDFYLFDAARRLVYRGQLDPEPSGQRCSGDWPGSCAAIDNLLARGQPLVEQSPSLGCNIKWKAGNEPAFWTTPG